MKATLNTRLKILYATIVEGLTSEDRLSIFHTKRDTTPMPQHPTRLCLRLQRGAACGAGDVMAWARGRRRGGASARRALMSTTRQRVDPAEGGIPELVRVGQEHFDKATLPVRSPHHGASGEASPPQRLHRVSCAAVRRGTSHGSLTIAQCANDRQRITVHLDVTPVRLTARTAARPRPNRTGK